MDCTYAVLICSSYLSVEDMKRWFHFSKWKDGWWRCLCIWRNL